MSPLSAARPLRSERNGQTSEHQCPRYAAGIVEAFGYDVRRCSAMVTGAPDCCFELGPDQAWCDPQTPALFEERSKSTTSYVRGPRGDSTSTRSPLLRPNMALPSGEPTETQSLWAR